MLEARSEVKMLKNRKLAKAPKTRMYLVPAPVTEDPCWVNMSTAITGKLSLSRLPIILLSDWTARPRSRQSDAMSAKYFNLISTNETVIFPLLDIFCITCLERYPGRRGQSPSWRWTHPWWVARSRGSLPSLYVRRSPASRSWKSRSRFFRCSSGKSGCCWPARGIWRGWLQPVKNRWRKRLPVRACVPLGLWICRCSDIDQSDGWPSFSKFRIRCMLWGLRFGFCTLWDGKMWLWLAALYLRRKIGQNCSKPLLKTFLTVSS